LARPSGGRTARGLAGDAKPTSESEDALSKLQALLVVGEFVAVALLELRQLLLFGGGCAGTLETLIRKLIAWLLLFSSDAVT
jgi:hypothetical protein